MAAVLFAAGLTVAAVFAVLLVSAPQVPSVSLTPVRVLGIGAHAVESSVPLGRSELLARSAALLGLLVYAFLAALAAGALYRRTSAGEACFLHLFLVSLNVEALRLPSLYLYAAAAQVNLVATLTRVVHMGRLVGLIALFMVALYSMGLRYSAHGTATAVGLLVASMIAVFVPVDSSRFTRAFLYTVSHGGGLLSVTTTGIVIILLAVGIAPLIRRDRSLFVLTAAVVCLLAGHELESLGSIVASGAGLPLLVLGAILSIRRVERFYLRIY